MVNTSAKQPKVSVALSVYNGAATLSDALATVVAQTYADFEIIAVDDASTDTSPDLLEVYARHDERMVFVRNEANRGLANSLNKAIAMARGEYIMRMDQDDLSLGDRLEQQVAFLEANPEIGLVSCFVDALFSHDFPGRIRVGVRQFEEYRRSVATAPPAIAAALSTLNMFHHGEVLFRRQLWADAGGYRPLFFAADDYDLWLRMAPLTSFYILPKVGYIKRFDAYSTSANTPSQHIVFMASLARRCYRLRLAGEDDAAYARREVRRYLSEHGLSERFAHQIGSGGE